VKLRVSLVPLVSKKNKLLI